MMKVDQRYIRTSVFLQGLVIVFVVIGVAKTPVNAQGICVPDTLSVKVISGKVVAVLDKGETPLTEALITLQKGDNDGPIVAKQSINEDGSFGFGPVKPGKYQLKVTAPAFRDFYLDLQVRRSKITKNQKDIIIIMGTDFTKPCSGSAAELRVRRNG